MKATGWDDGLCQDYDKGLAKWFSSRLSAKNDFLKGQDMIRIPPQHNTTNPPGQIGGEVLQPGVVSPTKQLKDLASEISDFHLSNPMRAMEKHKEEYRKAADGCCHKTMLQQCVDCPYKDMKCY